MNHYNIFKISLLVSITFCICSCDQHKETKTQKLTRVETITPHRGLWKTTIEASGMVGNDSQLNLSFKTGGLVSSVYTNKGDFVKKGALIATLNTTELDAQIDQDRLKIDKIKRDLKRAEILVKDTIATLEQVQDLQTQLAVAQEEIRSLIFNKSQTVLTAPKSGFILDQQLSEGEYKNPGSPVVTIGSKDSNSATKWIFTAGVPDKDRVHLKVGQPVTVSLDVFTNISFQGIIQRLSSVPNAKTGTYEVVISFEANDVAMVYGLTGTFHARLINTDTYDQIPVTAFVSLKNNLKGTIYTINAANEVEEKEVHILGIDKDKITIREHFNKQINIIVTGKSKVKPGQKVEIVK
ncbi:efflux RND transporter periplasmic adaptor subunit [Zhouia sp. PK063]|uniref:efflux RND transporter periplasmic adaptor subunit n=1 Tax=Zhouia sp. PK063 TaxID=3373602 RepID=UPI0037BD8BF3